MSIAERKAALNLQHVGKSDDRDKLSKRPTEADSVLLTERQSPAVAARPPPPPLPLRNSSSTVSTAPRKPPGPALPPRQPSNPTSITPSNYEPLNGAPGRHQSAFHSPKDVQTAAPSRASLLSSAAGIKGAMMNSPFHQVPADPGRQSSNTLSTMRSVSSTAQHAIGRDNTRKLAGGVLNAATSTNGSATSRLFDRAAGQVEGGSSALNSLRNASAATERTIGKDNAQKLRGHMIEAAMDANEASRPTDDRPPLPPTRSSPASNLSTRGPPPLPMKPPLPPKSQMNTSIPPTQVPQGAYTPVRRSALDMGFNNKAVTPTQTSSDSIGIGSLKGAFKKLTASTPAATNIPPPQLNLATKPRVPQQGLSARQPLGYGRQIMAATVAPSQLRYSLAPSENGRDCLLCRDFSVEDTHASRFPRQTVSSLEQLAHDLTAPFSSLTSKARAIFTWMHYNVSYNTEAFFAGNVKSSTPASTLSTGLAVCEGYAGLFSNLALHAGLECVTVAGHGKGFGHEPLKPGQAIPPFKSSHAWNACKIDDADGGWKLIDPCWGAGHINDQRRYVAKLAPEHFAASNADFGLRHFPEDQTQFYLLAPDAGGPSQPPTWEEYFSSAAGTSSEDVTKGPEAAPNGFGLASCFSPRSGQIDLVAAAAQAPKMRFEIHKICRHWDKIWLQGKGKRQTPFMMYYGSNADTKWLPFVPISGGTSWFVVLDVDDVRRRCKPGDRIWCMTITEFDGRDAGGVSASEVVAGVGRVSMNWQGVACWTVASG